MDQLAEGSTMRLMTLMALSLVAVTASAEGWLCVADSAVGFRFDLKTGKWNPITLVPTSKYIIERDPKDRPSPGTAPGDREYILQNAATPDHLAIFGLCFRHMESGEHIRCPSVVSDLAGRPSEGTLHLKVDEPRFTFTSSNDDFWSTKQALQAAKRQPDDMYMEIGRCSAL